MKKRILALLLALVFVSLLCACVIHKDSFSFTPNYEQKQLTLTLYLGSDENVSVPSKHWGMPVEAIGKEGFSSTPYVKGIVLPNTVKRILSLAFSGCTSLESVKLPDSLEKIESGAFQGCTSLKEIYIPKNVNRIEPGAFNGCTSLIKFEVDKSNTDYSAIDGHLYYRNTTLIAVATASVGKEFTVPDGTAKISTGAFSDCSSLETVHIPASVKDIASDAFSDCSSIREIHFKGTSSEWYAMQSRPSFGNRYVSIVCSNGTISSTN